MDLDNIKRFCRTFLTSIHRETWCFSYFTAHDNSHAEKVWKFSLKIAGGKLSTFEKLLLQSACWCHDVGMASYTSQDKIEGGNNGEYCAHVRKNHNIRSENFVDTFKDKMGLNDKEAFIIGRLCYAHSSKANLNELNQTDPIFNGTEIENVRTKLLASILRIADALDASEDRLPVENYIQDAPFESKYEYLKHMVTKKVTVDSEKILIELSNQHKEEAEAVKLKFIEEFSSVKEVLEEADLVSKLEFKYIDTHVDKLDFIPNDVKRIMELYVKPSCFEEIYDKLEKHNIVIISGDANVGKTSTAHYIAGLRYEENKNPIFLVRQETKYQPISNYTIVIDDAFGESDFENRFSISYKEIFQFKEENKVIITSREQILSDALMRNRIGEVDYNNWKVEVGQEGSYGDDSLKEILLNHLRYYEKMEKINDEDVKIAKKYQLEIIKALRFPHNIDVFVKEKLKDVSMGKSLNEALNESKYIKTVAKKWFMSLDDKRKFFILTVWLFTANVEYFDIIYLNTVDTLKIIKSNLEIEDLNELIKTTNSFIILEEYGLNEDKIQFRHQNYREGIDEAISESFGIYIKHLGPLFQTLYKLHKGFNFRNAVNHGLKRIAFLNPDWAFNLLKELVSDEDWRVKRQAALVLGELGYMDPDESISLLKELASDDDWKVREYVAEALVFSINDLVENRYFLPEAYKLLKELAFDENCNVKAKVAEVLGQFGFIRPDESIDLLTELVNVNDCLVKSKVAESLGNFGFIRLDRSIDLLTKLANNKEFWKVRKEVINALFSRVEIALLDEKEDIIDVGFLKCQSAFKILEKLVNDKDSRVKECLGQALVMGLIDLVNLNCFSSSEYSIMLEKLVNENDCRVKIAIQML